MTPKPHRVLINRVSGYAAEASAYRRRRRHNRRPFSRTLHAGGKGLDHPLGSPIGDQLQDSASELIASLEGLNSANSGPGVD